MNAITRPRDHRAVMASRREPPKSLDYFPTPPWATRALLQHILAGEPLEDMTCWEPAAGEGHMALVLAERFADVCATDVFDYGALDHVGSFIGKGPDVLSLPRLSFDWIITNPPFGEAVNFALRAIDEARVGVAMLVRLGWLEGVERYNEIFSRHPPSIIAPFAERVPLTKGRWDPDASTATAYCWIVWHRGWMPRAVQWIPPGQRKALTHVGDAARFGIAEAVT